jgi:hypothetical protein
LRNNGSYQNLFSSSLGLPILDFIWMTLAQTGFLGIIFITFLMFPVKFRIVDGVLQQPAELHFLYLRYFISRKFLVSVEFPLQTERLDDLFSIAGVKPHLVK